MDSLAGASRSGKDAGRDTIVPLRSEDARALRLPSRSRFVPALLEHHVAAHPSLAFRAAGTDEYVVGGFWRRRPEIIALFELVGKRASVLLLSALVDAARAEGATMLLIDPHEEERQPSFYRRHGFQIVERLVQMERRRTDAPRGVAGAPIRAMAGAPIRAMAAADIPAVLDLERHSFPWFWWNSEPEFLWYASVPGVALYVAEDRAHHARIVGYIGFTIFGREAHLDRLAVHTRWQRQGYGAALLAFALLEAERAGARRVALATQLDNEHSQALYARFGFRPSGWEQEILGLSLGERA